MPVILDLKPDQIECVLAQHRLPYRVVQATVKGNRREYLVAGRVSGDLEAAIALATGSRQVKIKTGWNSTTITLVS